MAKRFVSFLMLCACLVLLTHCQPAMPEGSGGGAGSPVVPAVTPTPGNIGIPVEDNCATLTDPAQASACRTFMSNESNYVLPALEDISGIRLADCLDRIRFEFNTSTTNLGQAYQDGRTGMIQFNTTLTPQYFTATPPLVFDDHEPVHILFQCAHIPQTYNIHHVFFFAVQAELNTRIYERSGHALALASQLAATNRQYVQDWFQSLSRDPSPFAAATGQFAGCPGGVSYILFADYLRPHHEIVRDWFQAIYNDSELRTLPYASAEADQRFLQLMVTLMTPTPAMHDYLAPYCPALPSR